MRGLGGAAVHIQVQGQHCAVYLASGCNVFCAELDLPAARTLELGKEGVLVPKQAQVTPHAAMAWCAWPHACIFGRCS